MNKGERDQQPNVIDLSEADLEARVTEIETQLLPTIRNQRGVLLGQISQLRTELRPLERRYVDLTSQAAALDAERSMINEQLRAVTAERQQRNEALERLRSGRENLLRTPDTLHHSLASVLEAMAADSRFVRAIPNLIESDLEKYNSKTNGDRIRIATSDDSCRMILFDNQTYALIYNPKPQQPEMADIVEQALKYTTTYTRHGVDKHIFGIGFEPRAGTTRTFALEFDNEQRASGVFIPLNPGIDPLLDHIGNIVSTGDISLPKSFGKVTIQRGPQTQ